MLKKGQATIFVILGIVIIVIVGLFLYLGSEFLPGIIKPADFNDVEEAIQNCVDETLINAKDFKGDVWAASKQNTIRGYEEGIKNYFLIYFDCSEDLRRFSNIFEIEYGKDKFDVDVQAVGGFEGNELELEKIIVTLEDSIIVSRGDNQERFETFVSEYKFVGYNG